MNAREKPAQHGANSPKRKRVVIIGLDPSLIDFSSQEFAAFPGLTAEKVIAGITAAEEGLRALGFEAEHCHIDFGETAEQVVRSRLQQQQFECILVGAGVRAVSSNFILFEKLINVIHELAPKSKICFNTSPADTLQALQRWV